MSKMAGKAFGGGKQAVVAATKEAIIGKSCGRRRPHHPPFASKGSLINTELKAKQTPPALSHLGKFLGIVEPPRSDFSKIVSKFIKLHNRQNPTMWRDRSFEDKLVSAVTTGQRIGAPEMAKLLSR